MTEIVEEPYLQLIRDILDHGHMKDDRTGTGTKSLFVLLSDDCNHILYLR